MKEIRRYHEVEGSKSRRMGEQIGKKKKKGRALSTEGGLIPQGEDSRKKRMLLQAPTKHPKKEDKRETLKEMKQTKHTIFLKEMKEGREPDKSEGVV